jgi:hypothetical protein
MQEGGDDVVVWLAVAAIVFAARVAFAVAAVRAKAREGPAAEAGALPSPAGRATRQWQEASLAAAEALVRWRAAHPAATVDEVERELDRRLTGARTRLLRGLTDEEAERSTDA